MADAAIGGKTALNYKGIRNLLGTYKNPKEIIISTDFISTLSQENIRNGCAEIIKYALIMDSNLFENIEENIANIFPNPDINIITPIIKRCINHKRDIVNQDQYDQNIRNILNFGHTLGHALESYYDFKMSHGEAILYGMRVASHLSKKANHLNYNDYQRIIKLIEIFKLPKLENFDSDQIMSYINSDKKNIGNELNYILLKNIGTAVIEKNYNKALIKEGLEIL
jgi:3-dehydroquinate synthase